MIKPLNDYVVLKYKKEEIQSKSGILLKLKGQDKEKNIGIVMSCGPHVKGIMPNDKVVFQDHSVTEIKIEEDKEEYLILKSEYIIAVLV